MHQKPVPLSSCCIQRVSIAVRGNIAKFRAHPSLQDYLIGTRKRVLVEASPVDRIWGIGLEATD